MWLNFCKLTENINLKFLCFCQDVTPYMNPCPYMVYPWTPVPLVFNLFRTMGLRHLIVINTKGQVCRNHLFA